MAQSLNSIESCAWIHRLRRTYAMPYKLSSPSDETYNYNIQHYPTSFAAAWQRIIRGIKWDISSVTSRQFKTSTDGDRGGASSEKALRPPYPSHPTRPFYCNLCCWSHATSFQLRVTCIGVIHAQETCSTNLHRTECSSTRDTDPQFRILDTSRFWIWCHLGYYWCCSGSASDSWLKGRWFDSRHQVN